MLSVWTCLHICIGGRVVQFSTKQNNRQPSLPLTTGLTSK